MVGYISNWYFLVIDSTGKTTLTLISLCTDLRIFLGYVHPNGVARSENV